eukprot:1188073-Prorocentrum_minimum.AAC.4
MSSMGATAVLLKPYTGWADEGTLVSTLNFLYLTLFFSPAIIALSRGAMSSTNLSGILLSWLTGKKSTSKFVSDTVFCILGTYIGVCLLALVLQVRAQLSSTPCQLDA